MSKGKPMHSTNSEKKVETRQRVGTKIKKRETEACGMKRKDLARTTSNLSEEKCVEKF
jgi:hypothetical protein